MGFFLTRTLGLDQVRPTAAEVDAPMPGDALLPSPDAVMDRAFTLRAPPEDVWPWLVQLGKHRAGWYMTHRVERFVPRARRASRHVDQRWQHLVVGSVIPDYGGRDKEQLTVAEIDPPHTLVYASRRGRMEVTWAITIAPLDDRSSRVRLRLPIGAPSGGNGRSPSLARRSTSSRSRGLAGGLRERVEPG